MCQSWIVEDQLEGEPSMKEVSTIGLDIAKNVYQCTASMSLARW
jgi:hypothetical protein